VLLGLRMGECSEIREKANTRIALRIAHSITAKAEPIIVLCFVSQSSRLKRNAYWNVDRGGGGGPKTSFAAAAIALRKFCEKF